MRPIFARFKRWFVERWHPSTSIEGITVYAFSDDEQRRVRQALELIAGHSAVHAQYLRTYCGGILVGLRSGFEPMSGFVDVQVSDSKPPVEIAFDLIASAIEARVARMRCAHPRDVSAARFASELCARGGLRFADNLSRGLGWSDARRDEFVRNTERAWSAALAGQVWSRHGSISSRARRFLEFVRTAIYMASGSDVIAGITVFGKTAFRTRVLQALELIRSSHGEAWTLVSRNVGAVMQSKSAALNISRRPAIITLVDEPNCDLSRLAGIICHGAMHLARGENSFDEDAAKDFERSVVSGTVTSHGSTRRVRRFTCLRFKVLR